MYTFSDVHSVANLDFLAKVDVEYVTLPGNTPITEITADDALRENCKRYLDFIEKFSGVSIEWIIMNTGRESRGEVDG